MKAIELHQAFQWDCDACGRENFSRAVTLSNEQVEEMEGIEPDEDGDYLMAPSVVVCEHCGIQFMTENTET